VQALGLLRQYNAMTSLINAAVDHNDEIRWSAVQALGELKAEGALSMLMYRLKDEIPRVRESTAEALGRVGHIYAIRPLIDALGSESTVAVRVAIIKALAAFPERDDVPSALRKALREDTPSAQAAAAEALGMMRTQKNGNINALLRTLEEKKLEPEVKVAVIRALATLKTNQATHALFEELAKNRRWQIRFEAALALAAIHDDTVIADLRTILLARDSDAAFAAAVALAGLGEDSEHVKKQLYSGLRDPRLEVRCMASEALGRIKDAEALPLLLKELSGRDDAVRQAAAMALAAMQHRDIEPELEKLLAHPFMAVRDAARIALKR
jgi:HEAT repeat protein